MSDNVNAPTHYCMWNEEECRKIPGFPNYYAFVDGRIWSQKTHRFLKESIDPKTGYKRITATDENGIKKTCYVHRMIAFSFIPNNQCLPQINHIDENKSNNAVSNLEWCTAKYNSNYGTKNERVKNSYGIDRMRKNCFAATRLLRKKVECIETGIIYDSVSDAARFVTGHKHKNNGSNITRSCANGSRAYGYHWRKV